MKSLQASRAFLVFSFLSFFNRHIVHSLHVFSNWSCHNNTSYFVDFRISAAKLRFPFEKTMLFRQVFTRYDVKSCQVHDETWQLLY